jgi:5'-3' exonuclease
MGIKDLNKFIKKHSPNSVSVKTLKELSNVKGCLFNKPVITIDGNNMMYRYLYYSNIDPFSHITYFLKQIMLFKKHGIITIVVFDGKAPMEKSGTQEKRQDVKNKLKDKIEKLVKMDKLCDENMDKNIGEIMNISNGNSKIMESINSIMIENDNNTEEVVQEQMQKIRSNIKDQLNSSRKCDINISSRHFVEVIKFLKLINCPVIESCGEGEATCSELVKMGIADYVLSMDVDTLVFGAQKSIRFHKNKEKEIYDVYELNPLLTDASLSRDQFIDFCILCGCDYTGTIFNIGPVKSYNLVKEYGTIENILNALTEMKNSPDSKISNKVKDITWDLNEFEYKEARALFNLDIYKVQIDKLVSENFFNESMVNNYINKDFINQENLVRSLEDINMPDKTINRVIDTIYQTPKSTSKSTSKSTPNKLENTVISEYSILKYL